MSAHADDLNIIPVLHAKDKTALSYWFPKIEAAGLPVPKSTIVEIDENARKELWAAIDGKEAGDGTEFYQKLTDAAAKMGLPCFLRTDHTSNKHDWENTCYLSDISKIKQHVYNLVEFSLCCDLMGMPWDTWVVREFLPTIPLGACPRYGNMPVCREFRFFVNDGKVVCRHPYWPLDSLRQGGCKDLNYRELCRREDEGLLFDLASEAGAAVGGAWSVDILETKRGWMVTDMAEAHKSFHWEGCKNKL